MAGGVRLLALGAVAEEPERAQRPPGGLATREQAPFCGHDVGGEAEPGGGNTARGTFPRAIGDQPVVPVRGSEEVPEAPTSSSVTLLLRVIARLTRALPPI